MKKLLKKGWSYVKPIFLEGSALASQIKNYAKKHKFASIIIGGISIYLLGCLVGLPSFYFGGSTSPHGDFIKLVGAGTGGALVVLGLWINNKRVEQQTEQNRIAERGQINTRFKDAATLLASENTSANLSGIYALHQIAVEVYQDPGQKGYVRTIFDIFCAFIRENCPSYDEQKGMDDRGNMPEIQKRYKPDIIIQTIIDLLFKEQWKVYEGYEADLSFCNLSNLNFVKTTVSKAQFEMSNFNSANFSESAITDTYFGGANISYATFDNSKIKNSALATDFFSHASFQNSFMNNIKISAKTMFACNLQGVSIFDSYFAVEKFSGVNFTSAAILWTSFCVYVDSTEFQNVDFDGAKFEELKFDPKTTFNDVSFLDTILAGYSYEEIIANSQELTKLQ